MEIYLVVFFDEQCLFQLQESSRSRREGGDASNAIKQ